MKRTEIRKKGYDALVKELGIVGMIQFIQEFEIGSGDYTKERHQWLDKLSFEEVIEFIKERQKGE
ncbi:hypothetical protein C7H19_13330 [Aphanothece hegewaldii CCALA 016]|uniref:Uncharacterized protein n=1 Tax=Aphanothece hegewaldii CCALA 016 TaxID=2107694 RepID=A0A2T1LWY5_9CHRO|nr:hypothetical protein [Aphanothece hegewaldii]PSF36653.1 hypothetical protein C7H19_13330 [Aphanothece hegewaldii CCALA 016]